MRNGFTLAELLIALAILGVIATFTIPKVLQSQQDSKNKAIAKEAAGIISQGYTRYKTENSPSAFTLGRDITPYMNYLRVDTTTDIDYLQTGGTINCSVGQCLVLHNGARIRFAGQFDGTGALNALQFDVDPDGKVTDGTTNGPGKSVQFWLYYNERITTRGYITPGTISASGTYNPCVACDPPWFSWD